MLYFVEAIQKCLAVYSMCSRGQKVQTVMSVDSQSESDAVQAEGIIRPDQQNMVVLSDSAAKKVKALKEDEENASLMLRVYITGGGCAGFSYGFTFDEEIKEGDTKIINGDVVLLIDTLSIQYLVGSTVDYKEGLMGSQFVVENPNATTTCGCGSSFSV